jgi:sulfur carrier protein
MQININNKSTDTAAKTLQQLANELTLPEKGVAVAVENQMIPRDQWNDFTLQEGAHVVIIKAACGG